MGKVSSVMVKLAKAAIFDGNLEVLVLFLSYYSKDNCRIMNKLWYLLNFWDGVSI